MKSKSIRALGVLLIAALTLSCSLIMGERGATIPSVNVGDGAIPLELPSSKGEFQLLAVACIDRNHDGCDKKDPPLEGVPVIFGYGDPNLSTGPYKYIQSRTDKNGVIYRNSDLDKNVRKFIGINMEHEGITMTRGFKTNSMISTYDHLKTEDGDLCFRSIRFLPTEEILDPSNRISFGYDFCLPIQRTHKHGRGERFQ
jgi:hypothetical protein